METKYHYTECGLDNIYLKNGFEVTEYEGEAFYSVYDTEGLHKVIALDLVNKTSVLTGAEIRFLRKEAGRSQKQLAQVFGKTDQAIAKWEKGDSVPDQGQDLLMRLLYLQGIGLNKTIAEFLERLELDAVMSNEREFQEDDGEWNAPVAA